MSSTAASGSGIPGVPRPRVLVYGYGNPGRQDDGLGVSLADALEAGAGDGRLPWLTFDRNYQLNVEDALEASGHDIALFLDASMDCAEPFVFTVLQPSPSVSFTTHAMRPEAILALCRDLYGAHPAGRLLTIRGYSWEPGGEMTAGARRNLEAAEQWLVPLLESPGLLLRAHA